MNDDDGSTKKFEAQLASMRERVSAAVVMIMMIAIKAELPFGV